MSEIGFANDIVIILPEHCSREGISHLHRLLSDRLVRLLSVTPVPERVELDFSEVREIDACGCQLLALFVGHLARRAIPAGSRNLGGETAESLALLGFAVVLGAHVPATEEGNGTTL